MKKLLLSLPLLLAAGVLSAAPKPPVKHTAPPKPATMSAKTVALEGEIVSVDSKEHTVTFKSEGRTTTLKVDAAAANELSTLKPGQKVSLTVRESSKGVQEAIEMIKPARS